MRQLFHCLNKSIFSDERYKFHRDITKMSLCSSSNQHSIQPNYSLSILQRAVTHVSSRSNSYSVPFSFSQNPFFICSEINALPQAYLEADVVVFLIGNLAR